MLKTIEFNLKSSCGFLAVALLLMTAAGCTQEKKPTVKKIAAGAENTGFLKTYANLKPIPGMDGDAKGFISTDAQKNLHKYIACVIDPVEVYLATNADDAKLTDTARSAATEYFRSALVKSVSDAFPIVDKPGPLVLRLRTALVGVDFGGEIAAADREADKEKGLTNSVNIGKVKVEMELLDSETGEQIGALVDGENLGNGVEFGSANLTRAEKWESARDAFDGWAYRVRNFLNASVELSQEDADRVDKSYVPYGAQPTSSK